MNVLFLHPNFPGQFKLIAKELAQREDFHVVAVGRGERSFSDIPGIRYYHYDSLTGPPEPAFPGLHDLGDQLRRGRSVADLLRNLRERGFQPDTVIAHPGWGDAAFIREVFPTCNYITYLEYYYRARNSDVDFDPEFPPPGSDLQYVQLRNMTNLLAFADSSRSITPTQWQASLFPEQIRSQLTVLHDGVDTSTTVALSGSAFELPNGRVLTANDEVITYVARSLEPYRGFHTLMRALPALLRRKPNAQILIAGHDGVSYGRRPKDGSTWRTALLNEVGGDVDLTRVHFVGNISYQRFIQLLSISSVHVYLTYPFVLSWSFLEAMACECAVVASSTGPVEEVITDGENGRLVDFFDHKRLGEIIEELLSDSAQRKRLGVAARATIRHNYDFRSRSLPRYLELMVTT